jgi:zinc transporter, ZIP family
LVALLTDLATGLGALPFAFVRKMSERWYGIAAAVAGGMMISASVFSLADQGLRRGSVWEVVVGMLVGTALFTWATRGVETDIGI